MSSTSSSPEPFWRTPPFDSVDAQVLYQHGINCVARATPDGPGMMSTGWALWDLVGPHQFQVRDFLQDGYKAWSGSGATAEQRVHFLGDLLSRLREIYPEIPADADVWSMPKHVAEPASQLYSLRAWTASELLEVAGPSGLFTPAVEEQVFRALSTTHSAFLPVRSQQHYDHLIAQRGHPSPGANE